MALKTPLDPEIKKTLRKELMGVYLKQADHLQKYGERSSELSEEITSYRERLGEVWHPKKKKVRAKRKPAKRKKAPWRCSYIECLTIIPDGTEMIKSRKRHYCSIRCALADSRKAPQAQ